ncbi:phospholipid-transporting ATPase ABCA1 [Nephila pilipes]|uniref:Phospholipid-transporting ATPase ABCA1 n=1 Tax=Nephila pilipes TaxID=299642 RepID=A0A8X6TN49_NEPPI|nr:phospholipid-transporting ATPase ABCA1 [Nephila pilipes]
MRVTQLEKKSLIIYRSSSGNWAFCCSFLSFVNYAPANYFQSIRKQKEDKMGFWNQLYLLLWKNFTLHKRQKVRLVVEVVWPLSLFLILMWVRSKGLKFAAHQCYFDEKAMPSAGIIPFLQNSICTFNNTCYPTANNEDARDGLIGFNSSLLINFFEELEETFSNHLTKDVKKSLDRGLRDFESINHFIKKLTDPEVPIYGNLDVGSLLKSKSAFRRSLRQKNIKLSRPAFDVLTSSNISFSGIQKIFDRGRLSLGNYLCESNGLDHLIAASPSKQDVLFEELCAFNSAKMRKFSLEVARHVNYVELLKQLSDVNLNNTGKSLHINEWQHIMSTSGNVLGDLKNLNSLLNIISNFNSTWQKIIDVFDSDDENRTSHLIQLFTCGRNMSSLFDQDRQGPARHFEELRQQMKNEREVFVKNDDFKYVYDNTTTVKCNALFRTLEQNQLTRMLWSQMKPFVRGKIIYSPNSGAAEKIMARVNLTFSPLVDAVELSTQWLDHWSVHVTDALENSTEHLEVLDELLKPENFPFQEILEELLTNTTISGNSNETVISLLHTISEITRTLLYNSTNFLKKVNVVVEEVRDYLQCFEMNRFVAFESEKDIEMKGMELIKDNKLWAGVVFTNLENREQLPHYIQYKIRMAASKVDSTKRVEDRFHTPGPRRRPGIDLKYITYGFAYLQDMIEHAIIREQTGRSSDTGVYLQQFPYPCYIFDQFIMALSRTFPLFMVLSWVYSSSMIIKSIVYEKEHRLKEVMKVMGLNNGVLWLAWFIKSILSMTASCFLLMIVLVYGNVMENSDPGVIFVFLLCYCVSTIMLSFLFSTLFSRANLAAAAGGMLFFLIYIPYPFLVMWEDRMSFFKKTAASLSSNVAFGFGCSYISHYEEEGVGAQWSNIATSPIPGDDYSMLQVMFMMLFDGVVYGILTWYIEAVFPGQYGVPKPWYFFFTKSYWCGNSQGSSHFIDIEATFDQGRRQDFEDEPQDLKLGLSIHHLTKVYSNKKLAVDDLSLNFYEGQITSFLGHNGAGKTTTISILTGMFPPTSGTAKIYGYDIRTDMDSIRRSLGTCPQHNVLFDELTVLEHLWFYARLKGADEKDVMEEANEMIQDMNLKPKTNELSKNLSGGMQRKLSIGIAFVGGSQTVILDEPTAGVDPYARRSIWELLLKYKAGRTVILTTHHMDEADLLGDRIAVIANGKLRCCGSSLFLKTRFGNGYYLTLVKSCDYSSLISHDQRNSRGSSSTMKDNSTKGSSEITDEGVADMSTMDSKSDLSENNVLSENGANSASNSPWGGLCLISQVTRFIHTYVADARLVEDVGSEVSYLIPFSSQRSGELQRLFRALDMSLEELHISSYGISDTTLEEVFLKVTGAAGTVADTESNHTHSPEDDIIDDGDKDKNRWFSLRNTLMRLKLHSIARFFGKDVSGKNLHANSVEESGRDNIQHVDLPPFPELSDKRISGAKLIQRQMVAFHLRRLHHSRRNIKGLFCEIVLPAGFICLALVLALFIPPLVEEPPLELQPWIYGPPNNVFFSNEDPQSPLSQKYVESLLSPEGMGTRCVKGHPLEGLPCEPLNYNRSLLMDAAEEDLSYLEPCPCTIGTQICPANALGTPPPHVAISNVDIVYNMTGRNISDWLIKTRKTFYKQRYGGFTFGLKNPLSSLNFTFIHYMVKRFAGRILPKDQLLLVHNKVIDLEDKLRSIEVFDNVKVWFNNKGWASSVAYMNAVNNLILRSHLPPGANSSYYGISVINHPMNFTQDQLKDEVLERKGLGLMHAVCLIFAMSFVSASFVMFLIEDKISGSKHLQFVSGVKPVTYWIGTYTWDLLNYMIPFCLCILIFYVFGEDAYVSIDNIVGFVLLLFLYGWASIPLMYPTTYLFKVPSSAFVALACLNVFIGIVTTLSTYILELFTDQELQDIAGILKQVYLIFPHYCLGRGLMDLFTNQLAYETLAKFGISMFRNPLSWDFLGKNLLYLALQGIIYFSITLLIEYKFFIRKRNYPILPSVSEVEDDDVATERSKVLGGHCDNAVLRTENLTKVYKPGQYPAVNQLCIAVKPGECFGLLGMNGAGKTTTFKMLTGNTPITSGNAFIAGHSIRTDIDGARQSIGYCPQFDALDSHLTGYEHLEFYARLRGIPEKHVRKVAVWGIRKLGLLPHGHRCAGTYSGGNKRKLSTAIALVGNPSVVFLDEPTTGMDPKARRFLWNCIIDIVKEGRSVILTSHSMEECEALCTRLAIMVNGQFRCLGSIQHLKNKYGNGYTLTLRVANASSAMEEVRRFIENTFGNSASLQEHHLNQMEYQLAPSLSLALVFQELEQARDRLSIEDYSVSQTTLDQVFISFAKMQADVTEGVPTQSIAHQIVRNKRGKRMKGGSENGAAGPGDIELLVRHSYASGTNQSPAHML